MDTGHTRVERNADNVEIVAGIGNELFFGDTPHRLYLIANAGRLFKFEVLAGFFHSRHELRQDLVVFARQKQPHILNLLCVFFFAHQPCHAGPQAASNLILQAGARAVAIHAVFALAHRKDFLQQRQRFTYRVTVRKRTEILAFSVFSAAMHRKARMGIAA